MHVTMDKGRVYRETVFGMFIFTYNVYLLFDRSTFDIFINIHSLV